MAKFTGVSGREWDIHLTLGKLKKIKDDLGIDLLSPWEEDLLLKIGANIFVFANVMAICVPLSDESEAEVLANDLRGAAFDAAFMALFEELSDFFLAGQREIVRELPKMILSGSLKNSEEIKQRVLDSMNETSEKKTLKKR